ncbi:hypothetical protein BYT27DRAFT_7168409 [Phlegmacium glaucopus]|nr:hypothetical protein BYT27DRAFT_7168409 [Phlegmacium glaucopus]
MTNSLDSFTYTVGKLEAGMAILLGERAHLIEFPSILLPPGTTTGSIVSIAVHQNHTEERRRETEFWALQDEILKSYGQSSPEPPKLSVRNVTQTSVTLEWPTIKLATAKLRSLDIYRNGERLSAVPSPMTNTSTKHSGMEINTEYSFQLVLRTTAGTFPSNILRVRTHTMSDTSGISVCFGNVQDSVLLENAKLALRDMGAKWSDNIQIDTSHFVCTIPGATPSGAGAARNASGTAGLQYQRALQLSIPVVQPHWILACHAEKRMVPIGSFYLGASSTTPSSAAFGRPQSMSQASLPFSPTSPPSNHSARGTPASYRASMPAPARAGSSPAVSPNNASAFINQPSSAGRPPQPRFEPTSEEGELSDDPGLQRVQLERSTTAGSVTSVDSKRKSRGVINPEFKFPPSPPTTTSPVPFATPGPGVVHPSNNNVTGIQSNLQKRNSSPTVIDDHSSLKKQDDEASRRPTVVTPSSIEVPAPPLMEKERTPTRASLDDSVDDDVGDTVDIPLN